MQPKVADVVANIAPTPYGLLDVPPEIRNGIYGYLVIHNHALALNDPNTQPTQDRPNMCAQQKHGEPALAAVSRQIRHEVLAVFYGRNSFTIFLKFAADEMCAIINHSSEQCLGSLRRLTIWFANDQRYTNVVPWARMLEEKLSHLREMEYTGWQIPSCWFAVAVKST